MFAFLDHDGPLAFAHRGGTGAWPENTMPAFEHAVGLGYRYLETDAHVTSDGVVVAFHDESLDRVSDGSGPISEHTWAELATVSVGGETIPRMDDLFTSFPNAMLNIDAKSDEVVGPLIELLRTLDVVDRVCVGSFSDRRLRRIRDELGPALCTSVGMRETAQYALRAARVPVGAPPAACLQVPTSYRGVRVLTDRLIERAHADGLHVHVWTIDDPAEIHALLDRGVDGVMTDRPTVLKDVLVTRDEWVPG